MNSKKSNKPKEEKLSEHFSFEELTHTDDDKLKEKNKQEARSYKDKLVKLAEFAESVRAIIDSPMIITSGFRCEELNKKLGGSPTSKHRFAEAIDFIPKNKSAKEAFTEIIVSNILYHEIILERRGKGHLIHIAMGERRKKLYSPEDGKYVFIL